MEATPIHVVYYTATLGRPEGLVRHLCTLGAQAALEGTRFLREARLLWPHRGRPRAVEVFVVATRGTSWHEAIGNILSLNDDIPRELEALRRADVVVFLASSHQQAFGRNLLFLKLLRADLVAAGRDPDSIPVLFQIQRVSGGATPTAELIRVLTWARSDHLEAFPEESRGLGEALDSALDLFDSGADERPES